MTALAPADAAMFWQSRLHGNDQFLLYCFAVVDDQDDPVAGLAARAATIPDLGLRVAPVLAELNYPRWMPAPVDAGRFRRHRTARSYAEVLAELAALMSDRLDATRSCWRLHLFDPVPAAPGLTDPGLTGPAAAAQMRVVVLQVSHALADGRRAADLARALLGGAAPAPAGVATCAPGPVAPVTGLLSAGGRLAAALALGAAAWRRERREQAEPPPALAGSPAAGPDSGRRELSTVTVEAAVLRRGGVPVTAGALAVLAEVLPEYVGGPAGAVELAVGRSPDRRARNNFHTAGIPLHAEIGDRAERAAAIAGEVAAARRRDGLPSAVQARRAAAWTPAPLAALGIRLGAAAPPPATVTGAAVVSSVDRGPADLTLCGGEVLFTAGFPAVSAAHALTLGVHGIGDAVTLAITCDPIRTAGADRLNSLLWEALGA
ncbi:hypothetical protein [Gordonia sp. VNK21]|uniref:hypothetical protein n=1 Tax=Gordonia sp. VNK21 TaxID=3382483 RepID=UPI0038D39A64